MLRSSLCTQDALTSEPLAGWVERLRPAWFTGADPASRVPLHRKLWEWAFIAQALDERGMLRPGRRGLGFGVGREPLTALFAGLGCEIVATDLAPGRAHRRGWVGSAQHAAALEDLYAWDAFCDRTTFLERVRFEPVDMNRLPSHLDGFDFTWSSCALEHLGSITHGQDFLLGQMAYVAAGGVSVHTTEFNLASDDRTLTTGGTVLLRGRDVEWLALALRRAGHRIDVDLTRGTGPADEAVAEPPYGYPHIAVRIAGFPTTSLGLIVEAGGDGTPYRRPLTRSIRRAAARLVDTARRVRRRRGDG